MNRIKTFFEEFANKEAEVSTLKRKPNIDLYNEQLEVYYSFFVPNLGGAMGHLPLKELRSESDYDDFKKYPHDIPRKLFKVSEYNHPKYQTVWVAFTTSENARWNELDNALFIIEESGELKIAKWLLYNHYTENAEKGAPYRWDDMHGYPDLNFGALEKLIAIERYLLPDDSEEDEGLAIYHENI